MLLGRPISRLFRHQGRIFGLVRQSRREVRFIIITWKNNRSKASNKGKKESIFRISSDGQSSGQSARAYHAFWRSCNAESDCWIAQHLSWFPLTIYLAAFQFLVTFVFNHYNKQNPRVPLWSRSSHQPSEIAWDCRFHCSTARAQLQGRITRRFYYSIHLKRFRYVSLAPYCIHFSQSFVIVGLGIEKKQKCHFFISSDIATQFEAAETALEPLSQLLKKYGCKQWDVERVCDIFSFISYNEFLDYFML